MESVTFDYDGAIGPGVAVAHIANSVPGVTYRFSVSDNDSSAQHVAAVGTSLDITVPDIGGNPAGTAVQMAVSRDDNGSEIGVTIIDMGTPGEYTFTATWDYDGANTVTVEFTSVLGIDYRALTGDRSGAASGVSSITSGTGALLLLTIVAPGDFFDGFFGRLDEYTGDDQPTTRLFHQGVAGGGEPGNPGSNSGVVTGNASDVGTTTATLNGDVNPEGVSSTAYFEYGLTTAYPFQTDPQSIGSGSAPVAVEQEIGGLVKGRTYHFRVVRNP